MFQKPSNYTKPTRPLSHHHMFALSAFSPFMHALVNVDDHYLILAICYCAPRIDDPCNIAAQSINGRTRITMKDQSKSLPTEHKWLLCLESSLSLLIPKTLITIGSTCGGDASWLLWLESSLSLLISKHQITIENFLIVSCVLNLFLLLILKTDR